MESTGQAQIGEKNALITAGSSHEGKNQCHDV